MLENLKPQSREHSCKVRTVLMQLDTADRDALQGYLDDYDTWTANGLSKALRTRDVEISANTIQKHRNNACSC